MKIIMLSTYDMEGGAAYAANRLSHGLRDIGVEAPLHVQFKIGEDPTVVAPESRWEKGISLIRPALDSLPLICYPGRERTIFSVALLPESIAKKMAIHNPDLIHLHWINLGLLRIETIARLNKPIVWTLHDMWTFTGGCHYDEGCGRYKESCGKCPRLASQKHNDLSHWVWRRKKKAWKSLDITFVTPSRWLAECAKASSLLKDCRVEVIPYGLDTGLYRPIDKHIARGILNLPKNKKIILFGATQATSNRRKGFQYLEPALKKIKVSALSSEVELLVFGSSMPANPTNFGLKTRYLGRLHDDVSLALLYSVADVFVAPSIQDNLPNTVMEALACGTPCVAFKIGGMPDMIEHKRNGYLARPFEAEDLAKGISWVIENEDRHLALSQQARLKVDDEFTLEQTALRYANLYREVLDNTTLGKR